MIEAFSDLALDVPVPLHAGDCPVEKWLAFLGHRWNALILWHLKAGSRRHGQLTAALVNITPKVLAERLTALESAGLIARHQGLSFPRTTTYALTDRGAALVRILDALELWAKADERRVAEREA
jgi:DNA-binding HxlR family transcriptional regulator